MQELTLPVLCRLATRLDPTHRAEILVDHPSIAAWVKDRMSRGIAWALMIDGEPVCAIGIFSVANGRAGYVWLAGARGWARHIRKLAPFWKAVLSSGAYPALVCDTFVSNLAEQRWVKHLGFYELKRTCDDRILYGVVT
jgi:hypothetical protein